MNYVLKVDSNYMYELVSVIIIIFSSLTFLMMLFLLNRTNIVVR